MNRAERKRIEKYGDINGPKETLTFNHYVYYYNLAMADALYCELGLDVEQIQNVFIKVTETMKCMNSGHINVDDLSKMCEEELGLTFLRSVGK